MAGATPGLLGHLSGLFRTRKPLLAGILPVLDCHCTVSEMCTRSAWLLGRRVSLSCGQGPYRRGGRTGGGALGAETPGFPALPRLLPLRVSALEGKEDMYVKSSEACWPEAGVRGPALQAGSRPQPLKWLRPGVALPGPSQPTCHEGSLSPEDFECTSGYLMGSEVRSGAAGHIPRRWLR